MDPAASVVILTRNEERNIGEALEALARQSLPRERFEVLVVDGASTDRTREVVAGFRSRFSSLSIIDCPERSIARSRNIGWRKARGRYVAFTDADCVVPPGWLAEILGPFEGGGEEIEGLAATGGGNRPPSSSPLMKALEITLDSFWGSHGSAQGIRFREAALVPHIPTLNILYPRRVLEDLGGFDEGFPRVCEDAELNFRLTRRGGKILYLPRAEVVHKMRTDLRRWLRNVGLYGFGRAKMLRKHPSHIAAKFLVPPVLAAGLPAALALAPLWPPLFALPAAYALIVLAIGLRLSLAARSPRSLGLVFLVLASQPLAYGMGEIAGALSALPLPRPGILRKGISSRAASRPLAR